ncbi:hypothetical protein F2P56_023728, partial [Juglans regia]
MFTCKTCRRDCNGFTYNCDQCQFGLDVQCSLLSNIITHASHEHQLILSSLSNENERDPKHWFYYCVDCNCPAHPKCILRIFPNLKFRKIYTFDFHQHPLTLVQKTKDHPPCDKCSNPSCTDVAY